MGHALRKAVGVIAVLQGRRQAAGTAVVAEQAGVPELAASSLKAALDADWDDPAAQDAALARVLGLLDQVEAFIARQAGEEAAGTAVATARRVRDQDVDLSGAAPALRRGVARDQRISIEDSDMRHGRKSRSVLFDGYKRHVPRDLDTGLVPAVGITAANAPEASVTGDITADLEAAGRTLAELHIDRAYLASALVRDRGPDLAIFCKAWRVRNTGGRFAKDHFALDFAAGQLTCPAGVAMPFEPGKTVRFPAGTCAACPLRARCTTAATGAAFPSTLMRRCWPSCVTASRPRTAARSCANASRSSMPWPTSGTGRAAVPATWASARTRSTCTASPWSTTSTSSPASPLPADTR
jgi:transposase